MQTFKQFLSEAGSSRSASIELSKAFELIEDHCSQWSENFSQGISFFRAGGGASGPAGFGDSSNGRERFSANTSNYFTWWHDNDPAWAKYPKRSRSFIGATSFDIAANFGDPYIMVPYDNANVAVLPSEDLFDSFREIDEFGDLSSFNDVVSDIFKDNDLPRPDSYETMVQNLKKVDRSMLNSMNETSTSAASDTQVKEMVDLFDAAKADNLFGVFKHVFKPNRTKQFHAANADLSGISNREVYIQGKCVFLLATNDDVAKYADEKGWNIDE